MKAVKLCLTLALAVVLAGGAIADEKKTDAKKGEKGKGRQQARAFVSFPATIELTAEQAEKLAALNKEYAPKAEELQKKIDSVLTEEQLKGRTDARKAAQALDKNDTEGRKKLQAAARPTLTDEQKEKSAESTKALNALRAEATEKATALLTDDQKAKLPKKEAAKKGDKKKPEAKKPAK